MSNISGAVEETKGSSRMWMTAEKGGAAGDRVVREGGILWGVTPEQRLEESRSFSHASCVLAVHP